MLSCAVIGCGPAGMAASALLRQSGLLVTCFDIAPSPGGIWELNSRDLHSRGVISPIYPAMRCVLPKDLMSFSDVRFDFTVPQFPHHSAVRHYLDHYAERKGVRGMTRFNTKVESVRLNKTDGQWRVVTVNVRNGDVMEWSFDRVCVCTGQTHESHYPVGLRETLSDYCQHGGGEVHHASHVKDFRPFRGKRVAVVGDGVSAHDYCMELKRAGAEVYHATALTSSSSPSESEKGGGLKSSFVENKNNHHNKRSRSLFSKHRRQSRRDSNPDDDGGNRVDLATSLAMLCHRMPGWRQDVHQANDLIQQWLRYRCEHVEHIPRVGLPTGSEGKGIQFGGASNAAALSQQPPAATECKSQSSASLSTADVKRTDHHHLEGELYATEQTEPCGLFIDNVDAVICATGYSLRFPFLDPDVRRAMEHSQQKQLLDSSAAETPSHSSHASRSRPLYMGTLYAPHPTLAFIGIQRGLLPPFLMFEAQARFVAFAFTQSVPLPATPDAMYAAEAAVFAKYPLHVDPRSDITVGTHSAVYFNALQQQLGVSSRDTYTSKILERWWWLTASNILRVYHLARSAAPLKRRKQHILFSNEV